MGNSPRSRRAQNVVTWNGQVTRLPAGPVWRSCDSLVECEGEELSRALDQYKRDIRAFGPVDSARWSRFINRQTVEDARDFPFLGTPEYRAYLET